jgi:hypothetical protein
VAKKYAWPEWKSRAPGFHETNYAQISNSQMTHEAMRRLRGNAFKLYCYMDFIACGKRIFELPKSEYSKFMDDNTFARARKELIDAGFIELHENNAHRKLANKYRFSTRWKSF